MTRADVIAEALTWVGTPWRHQACLKGVAVDCIGLIAGVALACGSADAQRFMDTPACRNYGRTPDPTVLLAACAEFMDPTDAPVPGDVLVLRFEIEPMHFAFLMPAGYILHAWSSFGVVHHRYNDTWRGRTLGAWSLRGIE